MEINHTLHSLPPCSWKEKHKDYARVTSALAVRNKPELVAWKLRVGLEEADRVATEAAGRGTAVHDAIERFLQALPYQLPDDPIVQAKFQGFLNWYEKYQPTDIYTELRLCDHDWGYIGTTDMVAKIDGHWGLYDFKTNNQFDIGMGLQLAAYKQAFEKRTNIKIEETAIIKLTDKTAKGYQVKVFDEPFEVFLAHLDIADWEKSHAPVNDDWDGGLIYAEDMGRPKVEGKARAFKEEGAV